jgi:S1-C subfamily serine protease
MMKTYLGCFCSALFGGLFAVWVMQAGPARPVMGQVDPLPETPKANQGPNFPDPLKVPDPQPQKTEDPPGKARAVPLVEFNADGLTNEEAVNVAVYENCNRSVVNITTQTVRGDGLFLVETPERGSGSGVVLDQTGHILTNYHVIEDARQVEVTLYDGQSYSGSFIGADPINDLAVLKIDAPKDVLFPGIMGDSNNLRVGMRVFAIGNPFGLERTMTTGIIASLNRSLQIRGNRSIRSIIQMDADINPGNSGGPLLNAHGQVIGLNTAIASQNGQSAGVGFAIPINLAKRVVPQLIEHGRVIRPDIGIQRVYETDKGLLIARLTPGGPAEKANLRGPEITRTRRGVFVVERVDRSAADLIIAVDGKPVKSTDEFLSDIESKAIGSVVELTIIRDGNQIQVPVTLGQSE